MTSRQTIVFILTVGFLCCSLFASSTNKIDSLASVIQHTEDTNKVLALLELSKALYSQQSKKSLENAKEALVESHRLSFPKGILESLNSIGLAYYHMGEAPKAILFYEKTLNLAEKQNNVPLTVSACANLTTAHLSLSNTDKAIHYQKKAIEASKALQDNEVIWRNYGNLGNLLNRAERFQESSQSFKLALSYAKQLNDEVKVAITASNLGNSLYNIGEPDSAIYYLSHALKTFKKHDHKRGISYALNNLGIVYQDLKMYEKALDSYNESLDIKQLLQDQNGIASAYVNLGSIHNELGSYEKARLLSEKAIAISQENKLKYTLRDGHKLLADIYKNQGKYQAAFQNYLKYDAIQDELVTEKNTKTLAEVEAKYKNEQQEKELSLLKKQVKLDQLELEKQKAENKLQKRTSLIAASGILLLLLLVFLFYSRRNQKKRWQLEETLKNLQTQKMKGELEVLERKIKQQERQQTTEQKSELLASITVSKGDKINVIELENITHFYSEDKYVFLYTTTNKKFVVDFSLTGLSKRLPENFLRIHGSFLINKNNIKEIRKGFQGRFIFFLKTQGQEVKITSGRSYTTAIKNAFNL